jgi:hypothetical protein
VVKKAGALAGCRLLIAGIRHPVDYFAEKVFPDKMDEF